MKVNFFVNGIFQGEREIGDDCIAGRFLKGDFMGGFKKSMELEKKLNQIIKGVVEKEVQDE